MFPSYSLACSFSAPRHVSIRRLTHSGTTHSHFQVQLFRSTGTRRHNQSRGCAEPNGRRTPVCKLGDQADRFNSGGRLRSHLCYRDWRRQVLGVCYPSSLYSSLYSHAPLVDHRNSLVNHSHSRRNNYGELGLGDTNNRGNSSNEMGDARPFVSLGARQTPSKLALGVFHTCALLTGGVKCWGCASRTLLCCTAPRITRPFDRIN